MKKLTLFIALFCAVLCSSELFAQAEFKYSPKNAKNIKILGINGKLNIEQHKGKDIILQTDYTFKAPPKEAQGLRNITTGVEDNTKVGLNLTEAEGNVRVVSASKKSINYKILIPENMNLIINHVNIRSSSISVKNFQSEIEIKTTRGNLNLENISGPAVLNTSHGKIKVVFDKVNQKKPSSIISAYGSVDVTLPAGTKSNLKLSSPYGDIYTDLDIDYKKDGKEGYSVINSKDIEGTINGGGVKIHLSSSYKNIYLRKK